MTKVTYKVCWTGLILNQCSNEELSTLLDKRPTADDWQVYAFQEMTKKAIGKSTTVKHHQLECGPMPNVMVALQNIGGALCSTPQIFADAHYWTAVQ